MKIFRDPIHNVIDLSVGNESLDKLITQLIDTPEFQRLRFIKQLGLSYISYPSANHSRFEHSLGVAFLAKRFMHKIRSLEKEVLSHYAHTSHVATLTRFFDNSQTMTHQVMIAGLLHDIGHGPLSHVLEEISGIHHEDMTKAIILGESHINRALVDYDPELPGQISYLLFAKKEKSEQLTIDDTLPTSPYTKLITGQMDIDKMDYLLRDSHFTGTGYGRFDLEWLLNVLTVGIVHGRPEIGLDLGKGLSVAEDFITARMYMFSNVYLHKTTQISQEMLKLLFRRVTELPEVLTPFAALASVVLGHGHDTTLAEYLSLTDIDLFYFLKTLTQHVDPVLRDIATALLNRQLYKQVESLPVGTAPYDFIHLNPRQKKYYLSTQHHPVYLFDKYLNHYTVEQKSLVAFNHQRLELPTGLFVRESTS